jgi:VanZ family protein
MPEPDPSEEGARPGFFVHVVPALLYVAAVFYSGAAKVSLPRIRMPIPEDKVAHFLVFGVMVFVVYHALSFELAEWKRARLIVASVVVASALGALLELVQYTIPYRDAEFLDWVADTLGALLAAGILRLIKPGPREPATLEPAERE